MKEGATGPRPGARRADALALLCVALFFAAFFAPTLAGGKFLVVGDSYFQSYPLRAEAWSMLRSGRLPLWTPHVFSGYPLLSMAQLSLGYPLTWPYLALPAHAAETIYVLAPFLLAPAFTYFYARETGRGANASLLAALAFAYGGMTTARLAAPGLWTNAVAWLPLVLTAIERARRRPFVRCLSGATVAYSLCVLNGHAQGFVYVGALAVVYAALVSISDLWAVRLGGARSASPSRSDRGRLGALLRFETWRPLAVAVAAAALASGVAAFQILETMRAARRSVRETLSYGVFNEGSFGAGDALRSLFAPPYHVIEVTTYVAPVALALAAVGACVSVRRREARGLFWIVVALVAFALMLGDATPLGRLVYRLPVVNRFRYPSRHAFEWTFAAALLAARGFDALAAWAARRARTRRRFTRAALSGWLLCGACALVGYLWWHDATRRALRPFHGLDMGLIPALPESTYLVWKLAFTTLAALAVIASLVASRAARRDGRDDDERVGGRVNNLRDGDERSDSLRDEDKRGDEERGDEERDDERPSPPNSFARALASITRAALPAVAIALACFVEPYIICSHFWFPFARGAQEFSRAPAATRLLQSLPPEENRVYTRVNLFVAGYPARPPLDLPDVTALRGLQNVAGYEQLILARYSRALGDAGPDAVNPRYGSAGSPDPTLFAPRSRVLDILNASAVATYSNLSTAYVPPNNVPSNNDAASDEAANGDAALGSAAAGGDLKIGGPPPGAPPSLDASRWRLIYDGGGVWVLSNLRACPRAWLVGEAVSVDGEEALRRIRGEGADFDPLRTALVEDAPADMQRLAAADAGSRADADPRRAGDARVVVYEPNRLIVDTESDSNAMLVTSEMFYPGWEATVDGSHARIHLTDYLLRGVAVPQGRHRVEMRYTAPAARAGAIISALTLALVAGLWLYARRTRARESISYNERTG